MLVEADVVLEYGGASLYVVYVAQGVLVLSDCWINNIL